MLNLLAKRPDTRRAQANAGVTLKAAKVRLVEGVPRDRGGTTPHDSPAATPTFSVRLSGRRVH